MSTQIEAAVAGALEQLGFEPQDPPKKDGHSIIGAAAPMKVTEETVAKVKSLVGKTIEVAANGELTGL